MQIKTMAQELGIAFLTAGFDPKWPVKDVPIMPKNRYRCAVISSQARSISLDIAKSALHNRHSAQNHVVSIEHLMLHIINTV